MTSLSPIIYSWQLVRITKELNISWGTHHANNYGCHWSSLFMDQVLCWGLCASYLIWPSWWLYEVGITVSLFPKEDNKAQESKVHQVTKPIISRAEIRTKVFLPFKGTWMETVEPIFCLVSWWQMAQDREKAQHCRWQNLIIDQGLKGRLSHLKSYEDSPALAN